MRIPKKFIKFFFIIVLVIITLAGGYSLLSQKAQTQPQRSQTPTQTEKPQTPKITDIQPYLFRNNVSDESEEASKAAYREKVRSAAVNTTRLTIDGCKLNPAIISMASSSALTVNNDDSQKHTLWLSDHKYEIQAKGTTKIKLDLKKGTGIYVVSCDNTPEAGIFYIVP